MLDNQAISRNPISSSKNSKMQSEFLAFLSLFLIGVTVILAVLFVNEKRANFSTQKMGNNELQVTN